VVRAGRAEALRRARPAVGGELYRSRMDQPQAPADLDQFDLGAHSQHVFRLYGGEEVRVVDIRGADGSSDPDVSVAFKNVQLCGALSTLQDYATTLTELLAETEARRMQIEDYATVLVERRAPIVGPRRRLSRRGPV